MKFAYLQRCFVFFLLINLVVIPFARNEKVDGIAFQIVSVFITIAFAANMIPILPPGIRQVISAGGMEYMENQTLPNVSSSKKNIITRLPNVNDSTTKLGLQPSDFYVDEHINSTTRTKVTTASLNSSAFMPNTAAYDEQEIKEWLISNNLTDYYHIAFDTHWNIKRLWYNFVIGSKISTVVVSAYPLGAMLVSIATMATFKYGIKTYFLASGWLFCVGGIISALSPNWIVLSLGRFLLGMGSGISGTMISVFIGSISQSSNTKGRSTLGRFYSALISMSIGTCAIFQYLINTHYWTWRVVNGVTATLGILTVSILYLSSKDVTDESNKNEVSNSSEDELSQNEAPKPKDIIFNLINDKELKSFAVIVCLHILQQICFANGYFYYKMKAFDDMPEASLLSSFATFLGAFSGITISEHGDLDMKQIGVASGTGCVVASFLPFCGLNTLAWKYVVTFVFVTFFTFGFWPIPWVIVSKIVPFESQRAFAALGSALSWYFALLFSIIAGYIPSLLKEHVFLISGVSCGLFTLIMAFVVPKLDGREAALLEDPFFIKNPLGCFGGNREDENPLANEKAVSFQLQLQLKENTDDTEKVC